VGVAFSLAGRIERKLPNRITFLALDFDIDGRFVMPAEANTRGLEERFTERRRQPGMPFVKPTNKKL
jgi:hypothetical protein